MTNVKNSDAELSKDSVQETDTESGSKTNNKASMNVSNKRTRKSAGAFRTISEVADTLDVKQHVLRFWETKFSQVKPLKRGGGRRYYRPEDVALLQKIHHLLYTEGYTIKGVQKLLKGQGKQQIISGDDTAPSAANESATAQATPAQSISPQDEPQAEPQAEPQTGQAINASSNTGDLKEGLSMKQRSIMEAMLGDLKELRDMLRGPETNNTTDKDKT
jgi:DNA-binding transcriptional MerR regulator